MRFGPLFGVGVGLAGIWMAVQSLTAGTVSFVFARLFHGLGPTLSAEFDRDDQPVGFWLSIAVYGLGGLLLAAIAVRALLS